MEMNFNPALFLLLPATERVDSFTSQAHAQMMQPELATGIAPALTSTVNSLCMPVLRPSAMFKFRDFGRQVRADRIRVMQSGLRRGEKELDGLREVFRRDGRFPGPLELVYFLEDGKFYLRDGHHRHTIMIEEGHFELDPSEYNITIDSCKLYQIPIFVLDANGKLDDVKSWLTPHNPRTHIRCPEFFAFKKLIKVLFDNGVSPATLTHFMHENLELYTVPRPAEHVTLKASEVAISAHPHYGRLVELENAGQLDPVPLDRLIMEIAVLTGLVVGDSLSRLAMRMGLRVFLG